jgi:hypothetical protein
MKEKIYKEGTLVIVESRSGQTHFGCVVSSDYKQWGVYSVYLIKQQTVSTYEYWEIVEKVNHKTNRFLY